MHKADTFKGKCKTSVFSKPLCCAASCSGNNICHLKSFKVFFKIKTKKAQKAARI